MKQPDFTMNSLVKQLQEQMEEADQNALTCTEIMGILECSQRKVYSLLDELEKAGHRVIVVRKKIRNRVGVVQSVPAYRLGANNDELGL